MISLSSEQLRAGHQVAVAAIRDRNVQEHTGLATIQTRGVAVHELRLPRRAYRQERLLLRRLLEHFSPHVVHTHGYRADVLHGGIARRHGATVVTTVHGFIGGDWKNRFYEWLQRQAHRCFDAVVAVSRPLKEELAGGPVDSHRLHCIPNAWVGDVKFLDRTEARRLLGLGGGRPWVGFVGRLGPEKGADIFVDAFKLMDSTANAVMIGDGQLLDTLAKRVQGAVERAGGERCSLRFAGAVPDAARYMKALDVFVLSSRTEGTPMALLEAVAAGVPVVAARVGGVPDIVSEGEAILVDPERPRELAVAIDRVLADPDAARVRTERAGKRLRAEFGPGQWVARYDAVYRTAGAAGET